MRRVLLLLACVLLVLSMWLALTLGRVMPIERNIIYAHVPFSICALLCFVVLLVASIAYLCTSKPIWDQFAASSAEVGAVLATISNVTGMIFARAEWGIWWEPSPRLITTAILWLLYVVYLILRANISKSSRATARVCAVFAIIAFLDVPMVFISARFMADIHRGSFSFDSAWQTISLMLTVAATALTAAILISLKIDILKSKAKLEQHITC